MGHPVKSFGLVAIGRVKIKGVAAGGIANRGHGAGQAAAIGISALDISDKRASSLHKQGGRGGRVGFKG